MLKAVSSITNALGALNYKGTWDASTNNPALTSGVGTKGDYYVVSVAGTTNLDGITSWNVGDWAVFNGSVWQRLEGGVDDPAPSLKSNSTTGLMQITGPAAGQTRVVTVPDANATMARTDAAQTFTGVQTLNVGAVVNETGADSDFRVESQTSTHALFVDANSNAVGIANSAPGGGGRSNNNGVLGLGSTSTLLSNFNYTVPQSSFVDLTIATGSDGFTGILIINNSVKANASIRTQAVYAVFGRGTEAAFAANALSSGNGGGGAAAFTISNPSTGVVRVTNNYAGDTALVLTFVGNLGW